MTEQEFTDELVALRPRLLRLAGSMAKIEDVEDLAQDTILLALRFWRQYRGDANLMTWCSQIMRNRFLDQRRKRAWSELQILPENTRSIERADPSPNPEQQVIAKEGVAIVVRVAVDLNETLLTGVRSYLSGDMGDEHKNQRFRAVRAIRRRLKIETRAKDAA